MPDQSRIQITTSRFGFQQENRPITANDLFAAKDLPLDAGERGFGLYVHVPFCFHKCHYCDFYSIVDRQDRQEAFTDRLIEEIHISSTTIPQGPDSMFVGGGTPTLLDTQLWQRLLSPIQSFLGRRSTEFTVEANPETVTPELAAILAQGGVNRVSIGAQSFNPAHLKTLERWHEPRNVARAVDHFRQAGIKRVNLDLIFGIPGQTLDDWLADLAAALALDPSHLSCYGLMYEPNTALTARLQAGRILPIEDELEAAMYEAAIDTLSDAGFEHYEISAWAKPGQRCRHNLLYWTNANWWPLGPSAAGHWNGTRWKNVPRIGDYLESRPWPLITDVERLNKDARTGEELMLGLRLIDGIERAHLATMLARCSSNSERSAAIDRSIDRSLLEWRNDRLRLTRRGLLIADEVIAELI